VFMFVNIIFIFIRGDFNFGHFSIRNNNVTEGIKYETYLVQTRKNLFVKIKNKINLSLGKYKKKFDLCTSAKYPKFGKLNIETFAAATLAF
jgi:hypothetical protein